MGSSDLLEGIVARASKDVEEAFALVHASATPPFADLAELPLPLVVSQCLHGYPPGDPGGTLDEDLPQESGSQRQLSCSMPGTRWGVDSPPPPQTPKSPLRGVQH